MKKFEVNELIKDIEINIKYHENDLSRLHIILEQYKQELKKLNATKFKLGNIEKRFQEDMLDDMDYGGEAFMSCL